MEVYSEDPAVIARLGAAYVHGIQHGDVDAPQTDILLTAASPKHFADVRSTQLISSVCPYFAPTLILNFSTDRIFALHPFYVVT